jgi:hypothetical protein
MRRSYLLRKSFVALCFVTVAGCYDTGWDEGITWLADSSGFVYTSPAVNMRLYHFDVATRKHRMLADHTDAWTKWPAVSPDGKQVAVARIEYLKGKPGTLQMIRYNLDGKELSRSNELSWPKLPADLEQRYFDNKTSTWLGWAGLFWSPQGDKMIVTDSKGRGITGILDLSTHGLIQIDGIPLPFAGTPIRPDGSGFLVMRNDAIVFVDWQGKEDRMPFGTEANATWRDLRFDYESISRWDGNTAVAIGHDWEVRVDIAKKIVTEKKAPTLGKIKTQLTFKFPDDGAIVQSVAIIDRHKDSDGNVQHHWLDGQLHVRKPGAAEANVIVCKGPYAFYPSPDRRWLAVRGRMKATHEPMRVIDRQGKVIAELLTHD